MGGITRNSSGVLSSCAFLVGFKILDNPKFMLTSRNRQAELQQCLKGRRNHRGVNRCIRLPVDKGVSPAWTSK